MTYPNIRILGTGSYVPERTASVETVRSGEHFFRMERRQVRGFAEEVFRSALRAVLPRVNLSLDDVDLVIPHQANGVILDGCARRLGLGRSGCTPPSNVMATPAAPRFRSRSTTRCREDAFVLTTAWSWSGSAAACRGAVQRGSQAVASYPWSKRGNVGALASSTASMAAIGSRAARASCGSGSSRIR